MEFFNSLFVNEAFRAIIIIAAFLIYSTGMLLVVSRIGFFRRKDNSQNIKKEQSVLSVNGER